MYGVGLEISDWIWVYLYIQDLSKKPRFEVFKKDWRNVFQFLDTSSPRVSDHTVYAHTGVASFIFLSESLGPDISATPDRTAKTSFFDHVTHILPQYHMLYKIFLLDPLLPSFFPYFQWSNTRTPQPLLVYSLFTDNPLEQQSLSVIHTSSS